MSENTVTVTDAYGNEVEVEAGMDGKNPVSPNNPSPKAINFISSDAYGADTPEEPAQTRGEPKATDLPDPEDIPETEETEEEAKAPARSASKGEWVEYAKSKGMSDEEANDMTKDQLAEKYNS